jgi:hypothetical protein
VCVVFAPGQGGIYIGQDLHTFIKKPTGVIVTCNEPAK